ncbi:hypothetical protein WJN01_03260 [Flavobacteriaceae bacterium SZ-1-7]|uniref:antibiotic biosynthesis monooxygenase family protein n=1 Tax=Tamlana sedimenti TaxID=3134126 RepID=UPI003121A387
MYIVLYRFEVKLNESESFEKGWAGLTNLIYKHEGSLGSRLHKKSETEYMAYAQWPNKNKFETAGDNLPEKAEEFRELMRTSCSNIEIMNKFDVVNDLLVKKPYE